ncbi:fungal-specific transcription factor domain-containing protein [Aspergillus transmontanensis]|uniref:Fungal-specific transcription factor domain-containing protein n=1 Tax=Aspergillus transmontanensis TaxID=1034304 RepID=A0A5N6W9H7_9EURO|nr:fungal-specific transcription factor domain-containing protein [Aspergillus transmontanensis]
MPVKAVDDGKRRSRTRSKIALACNSCREKKIRCDGTKPICGPCVRRSYRNDHRDEYLHALHQRIKDLEDICSRAGVAVHNPSTPQSGLPLDSTGQGKTPPQGASLSSTPRHSDHEAIGQNLTPVRSNTGLAPECILPGIQRGHDSSHTRSVEEEATDIYESPLFDEGEGHITGMGQIILSGAGSEEQRGSTRLQFYGTSSTASLMRFAWQRMPSRPAGNSAETRYSRLQDTSDNYGIDDFLLPPRAFADQLVKHFFDKVFNLYPFFHRPSFEAAYRNLWRAEDEPIIAAPTALQVGLGSSAESGPKSIVFQCALNLVFALGCQFADIAPEEAEAVANSFFLRAKRFIGLDFLDINTLGVVQTLLITALFLQSSPYPSRCWHSVGNACRVAVVLGLHRSDILATLSPLESEIRRRTWHGCVMMDIPSMTSHLAPVPRPDGSKTYERQEGGEEPSLMAFYNEAIKLYDILDIILADIYQAWSGRLRRDQLQTSNMNLGSLDIVLRVEKELALFEANLPPFLKWTSGPPEGLSFPESNPAISQQRNVLRARYIHLHLLLYRPIFTQLYSKRNSSCGLEIQRPLYSSMFSKCATACVTTAIDLTHLVQETYQTKATDAWWYNGFFLLMAMSVPSMMDQSTLNKTRDAWKEAISILESMTTFCRSATNTLQFLQAAYHQAVPNGQQQVVVEGDAPQIHQINNSCDRPNCDPTQISTFDWEEFAESMVPGLDDLGFLTEFNFHGTLE